VWDEIAHKTAADYNLIITQVVINQGIRRFSGILAWVWLKMMMLLKTALNKHKQKRRKTSYESFDQMGKTRGRKLAGV
jgi:hypothetical protein